MEQKDLFLSPVLGIFGQRIGQALQKVHERNGAKFYAEAQTVGITVRSPRDFEQSDHP